MMKRDHSSMSAIAQSAAEEEEWLDYDCLICTNVIDIFGVFDCGHYCCAVCAIRIFRFGKKAADRCCPMCRSITKDVKVVTMKPHDEWSFDMDIVNQMAFFQDKQLKVSIESKELQERLAKLYEFLCPDPGCWDNGDQLPFKHMGGLKEHLRVDHGLRFCPLCIENRPSFLCEQVTYTDNEFENHNKGKCGKDLHSFFGHPICLFCKERFYDGDALLKHMQSAHISCDVCNRGEFTFVFYKNRNKLIEHFQYEHKLCSHPDCLELDPMARVFGSDLELVAHEQRVHGAASRNVPLESLGFNYGGRSNGRGSSPQPAAAGPAATAPHGQVSENPATGRDVHAATIWFDFVTRKDSVSTMPRTKHRTTTQAVKQHANKVQLCSQVIPAHYDTPEVRAHLAEVVRMNESKPEPKETPVAKAQETKKPVVPDNLTPEEYNKILKEKLSKYLTGKGKMDEFRALSGKFIQNQIMATEYYKLLGTFFSKAELEEVFEPLAYSMTNETKRAALIAARTMMNTKEEQQKAEAERLEALEKAKADTLKSKGTIGGWRPQKQPQQQQQHQHEQPSLGLPRQNAGSQRLGSAARAAPKAKPSVWAKKSLAPPPPATSTSSNYGNVRETPASLLGETPTADVPAALLPQHTAHSRLTNAGPVYADPTDFPSLGSAGGSSRPTPKPSGKKSAPKKQPLGAWGK